MMSTGNGNFYPARVRSAILEKGGPNLQSPGGTHRNRSEKLRFSGEATVANVPTQELLPHGKFMEPRAPRRASHMIVTSLQDSVRTASNTSNTLIPTLECLSTAD